MEPLDLNASLKKLGAHTLSKLVGDSRLEAIQNIMPGQVTESKLVQILRTRYGSQILANKPVRDALNRSLPREKLAFLLSKKEGDPLTEEDLTRISKFAWNRTSDITGNYIELFGLDASYLPSIKDKVPSNDTLDCDTKLYPYQKRIKDSLVQALIKGTKRLLIHMPTGAGKTRTASEGLVDFWRTQGNKSGFLVWLTDQEELCVQAEETFAKLWKLRGDRPIELIRLWGAHKPRISEDEGGFVIASLQKLHRLRTSSNNEDFELMNTIHSRSQLVVVDEAHKSIAPTYKDTISFICDLNNTKLVGLTATPGRTVEGQIGELVEFYGNKKLAITDDNGKEIADPIGFLQSEGYLSNLIRHKVKTDITIDLTTEERADILKFFDIPARVLVELSKNDQRNALIIQQIAKLYEEGRQIIVFGISVEHSHLLTELLMIRGIDARCIDGNTSSQDRQQYIQEFKMGRVKVLLNYGVLTTGFDAPNTDAVVITRPTGSLVLYSQMIGRGIRGPKMGGTEDCVLIDLEDNLAGYPSEQQAFNFFNEHWENK